MLKHLVVVALSFTVVACGVSPEEEVEATRGSSEGHDALVPQSVAPSARRYQRVAGDEQRVVDMRVEEGSAFSLPTFTIVASAPMTREALLASLGVARLQLTCDVFETGTDTISTLRCTHADGRAMTVTEARALPELLAFTNSLER